MNEPVIERDMPECERHNNPHPRPKNCRCAKWMECYCKGLDGWKKVPTSSTPPQRTLAETRFDSDMHPKD